MSRLTILLYCYNVLELKMTSDEIGITINSINETSKHQI